MGGYSLAAWQAAVKVLFGGAAAVLGILLVRAGFSSVLRLDGQVQIIAFALIFGYSQQLLTRLIGKEATALTSDASPATPAPAKSGGVQLA